MGKDAEKEGFLRGTFLKEKKTRFLCDVLIEDKIVECYVPASCKFGKLIELEGREVLLSKVMNVNARTGYSLYAVKYRKSFLLLNLSEANRIIEKAVKGRRFNYLGVRKNIKRELKIGVYKTDLFIEDSKTVIEIKTLLSLETEGVFPSVKSNRAVNQLYEIEKLLSKGYRACYLIIALNHGNSSIVIQREEKTFYEAFTHCMELGMIVKAYSLKMENLEPKICKEIPVVI